MGRTSILTFFATGRQEVSGSTIVCQGEQVKLGDRIVDGVAILEQMRIEVKPIHYCFTFGGKPKYEKITYFYLNHATSSITIAS